MKEELVEKLVNEKFPNKLNGHELDFIKKGGKINKNIYEQNQAPA